MENSYKFLSIDEKPVSNKSFNLVEATVNLQRLQEHIFYPKLSINQQLSVSNPQTSVAGGKSSTNQQKYPVDCQNPCDLFESGLQTVSAYKKPVTMATRKEVTSRAGKEIFYERQSSVSDEDLFGEGRMSNEDKKHSHQGTVKNAIKEEVSDRVDDGNNNSFGCIPDFRLLGLSTGSDSESTNSPKPLKFIELNDDIKGKHAKENIGNHSMFECYDRNDSDFKMRFRDGRSISADNRREKYRNSSGGEVFDYTIDEEEYQVGSHVQKSNSLPDLITCSTQSPLSPPQYHSLPTAEGDVPENLEKQYELKKKIEGDSAMPTLKEKPKIKRTVSINDEVEIIPVTNYKKFGNENVSPKSQEKPVTPTEERRRIRSSGYVTGSSEAGSQDKPEVGTSRQISQNSQGNSSVWTSQDSVEKTDIMDETNEDSKLPVEPPSDSQLLSPHGFGSIETQNVSPLSSGCGFNDSVSTGSSVNTILDAKTYEAVKIQTGEMLPYAKSQVQSDLSAEDQQGSGRNEVPNLSKMNTGNKSQNSSFGCLQTEYGNKEGKNDRNIDPDLNSLKQNSVRVKQEHAVESKSPISYELPSGNLPNFSTLESFSLKGSSLVKVQEEEDENRMVVTSKYCREGEGSLQAAGPESVVAPSRGSSLSNQSSPSDLVKKFEEFLLNYGDGVSPGILEEMKQFLHGPDSLSSPGILDRERCDSPKDVLQDDLVRASRCSYSHCQEPCCLKMSEVFKILQEEIPHLNPRYRLVESYYRALLQHTQNGCEEMKCPVLFCTKFLEWDVHRSDDHVKNFVRRAQNYFKNPVMKLFPPTSCKFYKLQNNLQKMKVKEFETHTPMFTLGKFGTANVCMDNHLQKLVVLKTYPLLECGHQPSLYTRLKNLDHANIVPQLWMSEYDDIIQVCSLFARGGSLEDYLSVVGPLPCDRVVCYMKQILSAIQWLHMHGILYFYWSSGNMLFPDDRRYTIWVSNFSLSCPVNNVWDIGGVKECLPFNICPPELLMPNYKVNFKSDVWGAGCLFYEMLTGTPIFHHLRHEDRETVHRQIQSVTVGTLPHTKSLSMDRRQILESCWQVNVEDRQRIEDILQSIKSLRVR